MAEEATHEPTATVDETPAAQGLTGMPWPPLARLRRMLPPD